MTTREEIKEQARKLGAMMAEEIGDYYDIAEPFAEGYGNGAGSSDAEYVMRRQLIALGALQSAARTVTEWRVEDARKAHVSWQTIGEALDITRQAAQQRYGA